MASNFHLANNKNTLSHGSEKARDMKNIVSKFMNDESGATAIEYGLIAALIAVGIITAATTLGGSISGIFGDISGHLDGATP